jgi:hypothetical protein
MFNTFEKMRMMKTISLTRKGMLLILFALTAGVTPLPAKVYQLYYLGGQSNMDGQGKNSDLPPELKKPMKQVMIFHGNPVPDNDSSGGLGIWAPLQPGHGCGDFSSDGKKNHYTACFGVELSFAAELLKHDPDANIAIIKYSRGGTTLALNGAKFFGNWSPDYNIGNRLNQYDYFLATVRHAMAVRDIDGDGEEDILIPRGIIWMQGESDAVQTKTMALAYKQNLRRLMDLMRAAFHESDLPVVIGLITDSGVFYGREPVMNYGTIVQQAQEEYVKDDYFAALVTTTKKYEYIDDWHYTSESYLDLGRAFARAVLELQK